MDVEFDSRMTLTPPLSEADVGRRFETLAVEGLRQAILIGRHDGFSVLDTPRMKELELVL